jgi:hypothetical protein
VSQQLYVLLTTASDLFGSITVAKLNSGLAAANQIRRQPLQGLQF